MTLNTIPEGRTYRPYSSRLVHLQFCHALVKFVITFNINSSQLKWNIKFCENVIIVLFETSCYGYI